MVIIGSQDSGGFEGTPWTYAYDLQNREQIHIFGSYVDPYDPYSYNKYGCLTEKQLAQVKSILEGDRRFKELFPNGNINYDNSGSMGGIPMVDANGTVYFEMPIWGNDYSGDADGNILLLLVYNADTKEFDVSDILY